MNEAEKFLEKNGHSWDSIVEEDSALPYKQSYVSELMQEFAKTKLKEVLEQQTEIKDHNHNNWRVVESSDIENVIEEL